MDPEVDPEALSRELYEALTEAESLAGNAAESGATADNAAESEPPAALELTATLGWAGAFLDKMEQLLEQVHLDIPLPALFITPADLYQRAANLELVGDFHVTRV